MMMMVTPINADITPTIIPILKLLDEAAEFETGVGVAVGGVSKASVKVVISAALSVLERVVVVKTVLINNGRSGKGG